MQISRIENHAFTVDDEFVIEAGIGLENTALLPEIGALDTFHRASFPRPSGEVSRDHYSLGISQPQEYSRFAILEVGRRRGIEERLDKAFPDHDFRGIYFCEKRFERLSMHLRGKEEGRHKC